MFGLRVLTALISMLVFVMKKKGKPPDFLQICLTRPTATGGEGRKGPGTVEVAFFLCCVQHLIEMVGSLPLPGYWRY